MMVASIPAMRYYFPGIRLDARSNRRWAEGKRVVQAEDASVRRAVVLALGTNAGVNEQAMRQVLHDLVKDYPNAIVADWNAAVTRQPDQLQSDGIHPSLRGAHLFAKTIRSAFASLSEQHTGKKVPLKELPIP